MTSHLWQHMRDQRHLKTVRLKIPQTLHLKYSTRTREEKDGVQLHRKCYYVKCFTTTMRAKKNWVFVIRYEISEENIPEII